MAKRNGLTTVEALEKYIGMICGKKDRIVLSSRSIMARFAETDAKGWPIDADVLPSGEAITRALGVLRDRKALRPTGQLVKGGPGRPAVEYEYVRAVK